MPPATVALLLHNSANQFAEMAETGDGDQSAATGGSTIAGQSDEVIAGKSDEVIVESKDGEGSGEHFDGYA